MIGFYFLYYDINFIVFEILRVIFEEDCCVIVIEIYVWGIDVIRFFNLVVMYCFSGVYYNSRIVGYIVGLGWLNDYFVKLVFLIFLVYFYKLSFFLI